VGENLVALNANTEALGAEAIGSMFYIEQKKLGLNFPSSTRH
jgi:hypothetical protein